jgi:trigger factor
MDGGTLVRDQEFNYTFTFEISPEFDLPEYKGLEVEEEEVSVSEEETQAVIDRIRENVAVPAIVREERVPHSGDIVSVDFQAYEGDTALQGIAAQNFDFRLGMGDALPQFEEIVLDMLPGQTKKQDITFPQDFINESLAGKTVTMEVTLHAIKEKILPELNDDLAQKAGGYENLEQLKDAISKSYTASRKEVSKSLAQKALLDQIKARTDFELPASLVESHIDRMLEEFKEKLERQGKSPASQNKTPEQLREEFKPEAESLVRSQLVLLAIAQKEDLKVQPQEVDAYLRRLAMSTGQDFNALKDFYESKNLIVALKDKILADKAMDLVYAHAKVTMIPPTSEAEPENQDADS